jgi:hypothetical protein
MKRLAILGLVIVMLAVSVSTAMAKGKPADVITLSNGFPSGMHFNLNIHGKQAGFDCTTVTSGGKSAFIPEYGHAQILYVSNKKASWTDLQVIDPCGFPEGDEQEGEGQVKVLLPSKVETDTGTVPVERYRVYARSLGKPNNADDGGSSYIAVSKTWVDEACNDVDPTDTGCVVPLGVVSNNGVYIPGGDPWEFHRFESQDPPKKGKSMGQDISILFYWSGWVCDPSLNTSGDEVIDDSDIPANVMDIFNYYKLLAGTVQDISYYDANYGDADSSLTIDEIEEWLAFLADLWDWYEADPAAADAAIAAAGDPPGDFYPVYCEEYDNVWIFNIAELVIAGQDIDNDGTKLLQIRFYPDLES